MALIFVVVSIILVMAVNVIVIFKMKRKNEFWKKTYGAAENIIKEDLLNYSIQNNYEYQMIEPNGYRLMTCFHNVSDKDKSSYVFDPSKGIYIGRKKMKSSNAIYLNDINVSGEHCLIYSDGIKVYIQDCNSTNGTKIKRHLRKYFLRDGQVMELQNKDRLYIGATCFRLLIFAYDAFSM